MYNQRTKHTDSIHGKIITVCQFLRTRYASKKHGGYNIYEDDKIMVSTDTCVPNVDLYVKVNGNREYVFGCSYDGHQVTYHTGKWEQYLDELYDRAVETRRIVEDQKAQERIEAKLIAEAPASPEAEAVFN